MAREPEARASQRPGTPEQRIALLERIIEIGQKLNTTLELDPLLESITESAAELTDTEGCAILLLDRSTGELRFRVATAPNSAGLIGQAVPLENSIAGYILRNKEPLLLQDVRDDPRHYKGIDETTDFETRSLIGVPLQLRGKVIGVLEAVNKKNDQEMTWSDVESLVILANQATAAIENARLYEDIRSIKDFNEGLVQSLAEAVVVTDDQGSMSFVNPAMSTLVGYGSDELVGQHWATLVPFDLRPMVAAAMERRKRGESDRYQLELLRKDKRRIPVMVSGSPLFDATRERFSGSVAVFADITQALEHEKMEQELALAAQIQASLLPRELPRIPGWQVSATLKPARQNSGDFYDFIPLLNARLGILMADVAGKGMGAALYMAVSRTLLRTYATEYHEQPEWAFRAANRRLWLDMDAEVFITAFYGVLDPLTGTLTYCNAGHNPPFLVRAPDGAATQALVRTGMPLGTFENLTWEQKTVQLAVGDLLLLYTDGITDAEDEYGTFFGPQRLLRIVRNNMAAVPPSDLSAQSVQRALMREVRQFIGQSPDAQLDDIAVAVVRRDIGQNNPKPRPTPITGARTRTYRSR